MTNNPKLNIEAERIKAFSFLYNPGPINFHIWEKINGKEIISATNKVILKGATKVAVNFVEIKLPFTDESWSINGVAKKLYISFEKGKSEINIRKKIMDDFIKTVRKSLKWDKNNVCFFKFFLFFFELGFSKFLTHFLFSLIL